MARHLDCRPPGAEASLATSPLYPDVLIQFAATIPIAAGYVAALVINRSHSCKGLFWQILLQISPLQFRKVYVSVCNSEKAIRGENG